MFALIFPEELVTFCVVSRIKHEGEKLMRINVQKEKTFFLTKKQSSPFF